MLDMAACAGDFPDRPDWPWLRWFWGGFGLFHEGVTLAEVAGRSKGRLVCLATPFTDFAGGPVLAGDYAGEWVGNLAAVKLPALSPAFMAAWAGMPAADASQVMRLAELVVVPPCDGWRQSADVWRAVCLSLQASKPVFVLEAARHG